MSSQPGLRPVLYTHEFQVLMEGKLNTDAWHHYTTHGEALSAAAVSLLDRTGE
jgi:hypothetical protein